MENLVRPFETVKVSPRPGTDSIPEPVPNVMLLAGAGGSGTSFSGSYSFHSTLYVDREENEEGSDKKDGGGGA
jgi:hypothetical protein